MIDEVVVNFIVDNYYDKEKYPTLQDLADKSGVAVSTIYRIAHDRKMKPRHPSSKKQAVKARRAEIVRRYFGLNQSQKVIAKELGLCKATVNQVVNKYKRENEWARNM